MNMKWISRIAGFAGFAGFLLAQPNSSQFNVIPKADNTPGYVKFWGQKMNVPGFSVTLTPPAGLTADYTLTLPDTPMDGFIYYDSMTGLLSFTGAGTCGVDCMTLTTAQTATGSKTFNAQMQTSNVVPRTADTYNLGNASTFYQSSYVNEPYVGNFLTMGGVAGTSFYTATSLTLDGLNASVPFQDSVQLGGFDGAGPVVSYSGRLRLMQLDGITIKAGIGHLDNSKWESRNGYTVAGTTIVDGSRNATFVGLTIPTGAVNGYCWISDAVGLGSWQTCGGGGSFVTTGTNQAGLTGTKEWNDVHTHNANILTGAATAYDIGSGAFDFRIMFANVGNFNILAVSDPSSAHGTFWLHRAPNPANSYYLYSGSGTQQELQIFVGSTTQTEWHMRGSLFPTSTSGNNGDIGGVFPLTPWRNAYFSGTVNGANATLSTLVTSPSAQLTDIINSTYEAINSTGGSTVGVALGGFDGVGPVVNWSGRIRSYKLDGVSVKAGIGHSDSDLWEAVNGYSIGGVTVIDASRTGIFPAIRITTSPTSGYVLTSDASGNGTWQAPAGGSFVTTNTNQAGLSGTKAWSNLHTFNGGVAIKLDSTARNWLPESASAYTLGDGVSRWLAAHVNTYNAYSGYYMGALMELESDHLDFYNTTPLPRVSLGGFDGVGPVVNYGGRIRLYKIDGVTVKAGIGHLDTDRFESLNGFSVAGVAAIDGSRNANLNNLTVNSAITSFGVAVLSGGLVTSSISATAVSVTALTINSGASVGNCWTATSTGGAGSWQTCGGAISNYVTTNTNQLSGLTGDKSWTGSHTFGATLNTAAITPIANITYSLGTSSRYWSDFYTQKGRVGSGTSRMLNEYIGSVMSSSWIDVAGNNAVLIYAGANAPFDKSIVRVYDAGGFIAEMTGENGFDTSLPYRANGVSGISSTLTVRNAAGSGSCTITVSFGIVTASTC